MKDNKLKNLPLGTSDFAVLRYANEIYVDKSDLVYELASTRRKYFLARPRRFGKSLLISTFESLFTHGLRDFKGLAIEKLWVEETKFLVVRLDFSELKFFSSPEEFSRKFASLISRCFGTVGFQYVDDDLNSAAGQLSTWLQTLRLSSLVVLIDEYDAPLTSCLNQHELFNAVRGQLSEFYAVLKSHDRALRFVFITGITKFNKMRIFSELNNLSDISLAPRFGSLLGYTHEEVQTYFGPYIAKSAEVLSIGQNELLDLLAAHYDGFCFERTATQRVFSPWSLLKFLNFPSNGFDNYWYESGGQPGVLLEYLKSHSTLKPEEYESEKQVQLDDLALSAKFSLLEDKVLLAQTGYLTIKAVRGTTVTLGYPNREVSVSMARLYAEVILDKKAINRAGEGYLADYLERGDLRAFVEEVNRIILGIDYQAFPLTSEASCRSALSIMVSSSSALITARSEVHNAHGRSDLEIQTDKNYWVLEFKFCREHDSQESLLQEAVRQMKTRHYGKQLAKCNLIRAAMVFSQKDRQFTRWAEVSG